MSILTESKKFILEQYKHSPKLGHLFAVNLYEFDTLQTVFDALANRTIRTSDGKNLDRIGVNLNEPRNFKTDEEYRRALYAKILINNSNGTSEDIISIIKLIYTANKVKYYDHGIAHFTIFINAVQIAKIHSLLNTIKPAGVSYTIIFQQFSLPQNTYFNFAISTIKLVDYFINTTEDLHIVGNENNLSVKTGVIPMQEFGKFNLCITKNIIHAINAQADQYLVNDVDYHLVSSNIDAENFLIIGKYKFFLLVSYYEN